MDTLQIHEPVHVHDLPTGAPRWDQKVTGCELQPLAAVHFPAAGSEQKLLLVCTQTSTRS